MEKDSVPIILYHKEDLPEHLFTSSIWQDEWIVLGASVVGRSHLISQSVTHCQDAHEIISLEHGWGISVVCDGAGSAVNSALGAKSASKLAIGFYSDLISQNSWAQKQILPNEDLWEQESINILLKIAQELKFIAQQRAIDYNSLACTIIVLVFSKNGFLVSHIGDGRAGYCDKERNWHPLIRPYKGEEANQTVFITSDIWDHPKSYIENNVTIAKPLAFTLMSDGCETHAFQTGYFDELNGKYIEQNNPYPGFFNPLVDTLLSTQIESNNLKDLTEQWGVFVDRNSYRMQQEPDDKTLIIGVLKH